MHHVDHLAIRKHAEPALPPARHAHRGDRRIPHGAWLGPLVLLSLAFWIGLGIWLLL